MQLCSMGDVPGKCLRSQGEQQRRVYPVYPVYHGVPPNNLQNSKCLASMYEYMYHHVPNPKSWHQLRIFETKVIYSNLFCPSHPSFEAMFPGHHIWNMLFFSHDRVSRPNDEKRTPVVPPKLVIPSAPFPEPCKSGGFAPLPMLQLRHSKN